MPRYDVFISHSNADTPAVEHLARKLQEAGVKPFLDKWHLIPGEPWTKVLEEALDQSRTCALFFSKTLGPWENEEMRSALEKGLREARLRVIPILLPGGREPRQEDLPSFLRNLTWVDFRDGIDDEDAFRRLLAGIPEQAPDSNLRPPSPYRSMVVPSELFVHRREYEAVQNALLAEGSERGMAVGITTALLGAGGFGKTVLAQKLCYDPQIRERYSDGALWTTMGAEIDNAGRLALIRDLIRWWAQEEPPAFETVAAAGAHLRQALDGQKVLLVVDDVWRPEDVTPFQGLSPGAALLITTRDSRALPAGSVLIRVDAMEVRDAVQLLGADLPNVTEVALRPLAMRLGEWPLLLRIVNRQLLNLVQQGGLSLEAALREVEQLLDTEGLTAFDQEDPDSRHQALALTVGVSLRRLPAGDVERFEQLAIFSEDKDIPTYVLERLWGLSSFTAQRLCARLYDLSLLLHFSRGNGTIRLHDVIRAYLVEKAGSHLPEWNRRFLDSSNPSTGRWQNLSEQDGYMWKHLIHHLLGADRAEDARKLLLDFAFIQAKLEATDVNALIRDYRLLIQDDEDLRLMYSAILLSAHVLIRDPSQLASQLLGRLLGREDETIRRVLDAAKGSVKTPWICPRAGALTGLGGPLIRTLDGGTGKIRTLVVVDGQQVVSGSDDGTLCVWDLEAGLIQTLSSKGG